MVQKFGVKSADQAKKVSASRVNTRLKARQYKAFFHRRVGEHGLKVDISGIIRNRRYLAFRDTLMKIACRGGALTDGADNLRFKVSIHS